MQNQPLVTVICLCYNHSKFVVEALNSVINQTYTNVELIIADDFSSDNSVKVIKNWLVNYPEIKFIENTSNIGNTKTFNKALQFAKGDYIIDLAADDLLLPNCIETQINTFQKSEYNNLAIVYGNFNLINEDGSFKSIYFDNTEHPVSGNGYEMVIGRLVKLGSIASIIKTDVLRKVGGYDTTLAYEDLDIWVRITRDYNIEYIDKCLAAKRELETSLSAQFLKQNNARTKFLHQSTLKIFKKILLLNRTKRENRLVLNRMYFELRKFISTKEWKLVFQLLLLYVKAFFKAA